MPEDSNFQATIYCKDRLKEREKNCELLSVTQLIDWSPLTKQMFNEFSAKDLKEGRQFIVTF